MDTKATAANQVPLPHPSPENSDLSWCASLLTLIVGIGLALGGYFWGEVINSFTDAGPLSLFILSGMVLAVVFMCAMRKEPKEQNIDVNANLKHEIDVNANLKHELDLFGQQNPVCTFSNPPKAPENPNNTCIFENVHMIVPIAMESHRDAALTINLAPRCQPGQILLPESAKQHEVSSEPDMLKTFLKNARGAGNSFEAVTDVRKSGGKIVIVCADMDYSDIYLTEYLHMVTNVSREICYCYIRSKIINEIVRKQVLSNYLIAVE